MDGDQDVALATNTVFRAENVAQSCQLGIQESPEEALVAYDRIRREADRLIPLYDRRVLERHPGGRVA